MPYLQLNNISVWGKCIDYFPNSNNKSQFSPHIILALFPYGVNNIFLISTKQLLTLNLFYIQAKASDVKLPSMNFKWWSFIMPLKIFPPSTNANIQQQFFHLNIFSKILIFWRIMHHSCLNSIQQVIFLYFKSGWMHCWTLRTNNLITFSLFFF